MKMYSTYHLPSKDEIQHTCCRINLSYFAQNHSSINIKQIMTGLEGNRQIYLPREIKNRLPKSFY